MKIQKKALAAIAEITNELGDQFDELRAEIDRRLASVVLKAKSSAPCQPRRAWICLCSRR